MIQEVTLPSLNEFDQGIYSTSKGAYKCIEIMNEEWNASSFQLSKHESWGFGPSDVRSFESMVMNIKQMSQNDVIPVSFSSALYCRCL